MTSTFFLRLFHLLVLLLAGVRVAGQQPVLTKVVLPPEVLSGGIAGIAQDKQGFVWLATMDGLHRYDGYNYVSYYHDPANKNSLAANRTESICIARDGTIWIGMYQNGLDRFDPATKTFTHFTHDTKDTRGLSDNTVTAILEDRKGRLWVGTHGGLHRFEPGSDTFTRYRHNPRDPGSLSHDHVRALYEDRQGTLWIGTGSPWETKPGEGGLNRFNSTAGTFTRYLHNPNDPHSLVDNKVRAIYEDSRGNFWVGTLGDGLHTLDRKKGTFTRHRYNPLQPDKLSRSPIIGNNEDGITFIHEDATGAVWIGTYGSGVSRYDPKSGKVTHHTSTSKNTIGLDDNSAWTAFTSREGVLWIGTLFGNLYRTDPLRVSFPYQSTGAAVQHVFEDASGTRWAATTKGLRLYDRYSREKKDLMAALPVSLLREPVWALIEDRKGTLWIGARNGLWRRDSNTKTFTHFAHAPKVATSLGEGAVLSLFEDNAGTLWVGTEKGGLCKMDQKKGTFTRIRKNPLDIENEVINSVSTIYEDRKGNFWIGAWAEEGVNRIDRATGAFKHYLISSPYITAIQEDAKGRIWAGSYGYGLHVYDPARDDFVKYKDPTTGKHILTGVLGIKKDQQDNLWISTTEGVLQLDKAGNLKERYGVEIGLDPKAFSRLALHSGSSGHLFLGDKAGFYTIHPPSIRTNSRPPQIVFSGFRLINRSAKEDGGPNVAMEPDKEVSLEHDQNVFAIDMAGIHFADPEHNRLYFMLENYDTDWRQATVELTASYYQVPPGRYVFRVKAASSQGVWTEKTLMIRVHPPFWQTWWFRLLLLMSLLGMAFVAIRFYTRSRLLRQRQDMQRVLQAQEEERQRLAADLHDDLGATLSAIKGQLESGQISQDGPGKPIALMDKAIRDLRLISHNLMPPEFMTLGLTEALRETTQRLQASSGLHCLFISYGKEQRLDHPTELTIYRIVLELINNTIKHAKASQVTVQLIFYPENVTLLVEDNGRGYPKGKQSSGIGLRNIRSRVDYLGGRLWVDSGERGTTVTLEVPLTKPHNDQQLKPHHHPTNSG
ncbi:sensor histidine kinase [Telluribacter sp.]|uniref:sensor histidine kinase n=1 Tax=Telluribacter sp. TaxID=1978767 RepID=UPI002E100F29|nr:two-component regulator propeller domain-containing protein [Telluribacter sp.]